MVARIVVTTAHKPERQRNTAGKRGGKRAGSGNKPGNNGRLGKRNKFTRIAKDAVLEALERYGQDGKGKDGLVGFIMKLAKEEPRAAAMLLNRVIPLQMHAQTVIRVYDLDDQLLARATPEQLMVIRTLLEDMRDRQLQLPSPQVIDADPSEYEATQLS